MASISQTRLPSPADSIGATAGAVTAVIARCARSAVRRTCAASRKQKRREESYQNDRHNISDKAAKPVFHVQLHPAIHVHAPKAEPPQINVAPSKVQLSPEIHVHPAEAKAPEVKVEVQPGQTIINPAPARSWTFQVHRDSEGRISNITATSK